VPSAKPKTVSATDWHASMSVALGLGLGFFVLTAVAGVLGVGLVVGYQNTVDLLRQKAELIISSQREQTQHFLQAAENQVDFISEQITKKEVEPGHSSEFISLLLGAVAATPQIIRIQFIDDKGRLTGVERQLDESIPIFQTVGQDEDLRRLVSEATQSLQSYWGSLLWRPEYEQAVLNYQRPVIRSGQLLGIMSAWISINQLSEFLSNLESELGVNAFILHGRDQVLAHPLMAFGYTGLNRLTPLPPQSSYSDPIVSAMWNEHEDRSIVNWFLSGPGVRHVSYGDLQYVILFDELLGYSDKPWLIATYFESHDIAAEAGRLRWAIIFCFLMSIISASIAAYIGRQIAQPVRRLAEGSKKIHSLDLSTVEQIPRSFFRELDDAARSFNVMLDGLRWFERYVPKGLVQRLIKLNPNGEIESSYREVAILFTDIVSFTSLSENLTAPAAAAFLNGHFAMVANCVEAEGGTVDKFIGDSVMAIWGAPERLEDLADRACRCALAIACAVHKYNSDRQTSQAGAPKVRLRIGVHVGRVVVGNIGSTGRVNYTVVGDAVNVAQRLEEAGKTIGDTDSQVNILISGSVKSSLAKPFELVHVGPHTLRGREEQVEIYMLRGD
jgi:adenylate cyclase